MPDIRHAAASQFITGAPGILDYPAFAGIDGRAFGTAACHLIAGWGGAYFMAEKAVGVLPVTWRKACENAGTLA